MLSDDARSLASETGNHLTDQGEPRLFSIVALRVVSKTFGVIVEMSYEGVRTICAVVLRYYNEERTRIKANKGHEMNGFPARYLQQLEEFMGGIHFIVVHRK